MSSTDFSSPNYGVVDDSKGVFVEQNENQTSANRVLATHSQEGAASYNEEPEMLLIQLGSNHLHHQTSTVVKLVTFLYPVPK